MFIQDKFGWGGEGMTDPKYLYVDEIHKPTTRILRKVYHLRRSQIMASEPITEKDVITNEEYARSLAANAAAAAAKPEVQ